jgi:hypothetical protein
MPLATALIMVFLLIACEGADPAPPPIEASSADAEPQSIQDVAEQPSLGERLREGAEQERLARLASAPGQITIATPEVRARLCPRPDCEEGAELTRIRKGLRLDVEDVAEVDLPRWSVRWFKVTHDGQIGWISEFDTTAAPDQPRYH